MQDAVALCCADDLLRQQLSVRFVGQRIQAEHQPSFAFMAQRHVPRRLIQIRLETAVADAGLFREQIGEHIQHQLLCLVYIVQVAVEVQGQGIAVFFHQSLQPRVIAVQILAVKIPVADHGVPLLPAIRMRRAGYRGTAAAAQPAFVRQLL